MICRNIEFFKIIQVVLNFRSLDDFISHSHEDSLHLFLGDRVRVTVSDYIFLRRKGDVDHFCF